MVTTFRAKNLALSRNARAFDKSACESVYFGNLNEHIQTRGFLNDPKIFPVALYTFVDTMPGLMPGHLTDGHPQTPKSIRSHLSFCDVSVIIDDAERIFLALSISAIIIAHRNFSDS